MNNKEVIITIPKGKINYLKQNDDGSISCEIKCFYDYNEYKTITALFPDVDILRDKAEKYDRIREISKEK